MMFAAKGPQTVSYSDAVTVGNAFAGDPQAQAQAAQMGLGIVTDMVNISGIYNSTIGAVLQNGFNLSCWGASLTPQIAQETLEKVYRPAFSYYVQQMQANEGKTTFGQKVNDYIRLVYMTEFRYRVKKPKQADWSSCAKKAISQVYQPWFKKQKEQADALIAQLVGMGGKNTIMKMPLRYHIEGAISDGKEHDYVSPQSGEQIDVPVLSLGSITSANVPQVLPPNPANALDGGEDVAWSDSIDEVNVRQKSSDGGFNPAWLLLLLGLM